MITALVGENDGARQQELARLVDAFTQEHGEMAVEKLDGEDVGYDVMLAAVQSVPFLASKKLVLLRSPSACKQFNEQFESFFEEIADTNDVVLVEGKLDKRSAYYKALKKLKQFQEFQTLDTQVLARFAAETAKAEGGVLSISDARYLVERVGTDQLRIGHEVEKLILYEPQISRATIDLLTEPTPQSSVFDLLDAAFSGNAKRAMDLYEEQKALKVEPQQIVAMLAWQLHVLALIKAAGQRSVDEIARSAKISPYVVRKSQPLARKLTYTTLKERISLLAELDERSKTDGTIIDEAVRFYLLELSVGSSQ